VRFGNEIGGIMELGAPGRGEHMHISTYMEHSVDSELSGNVIDICPVGALTSKPYRYSARPWELVSHNSISPHDCVGSNIRIDVRGGKVMRVVPRENDNVNECWLADRDRFSYTANTHEDRLQHPMIKKDGAWHEVDWDTALTTVAEGLKAIAAKSGAEQLGALAAYGATTEEHYLLQKLMRGLGSGNIDHRLRQVDFRDQEALPAYPSLGQAISDLESLDSVLLIGSNIRKDQPLLAHRLRKASQKGAEILAVNPIDYDFTFPLAAKRIHTDLVNELLAVVKALLELTGESAPAALVQSIAAASISEAHKQMAKSLKEAPQAAVLIGNGAAAHPARAELRALVMLIAKLAGARSGTLAEGGNSAGAWLAGCVPHREAGAKPTSVSGNDWKAMFDKGLKGYLLLGIEPERDCIDSASAQKAMNDAEFVVAMTAYSSPALQEQADVLLPIATFAETAGSFINAEGHWQHFNGAVKAPGEARPAWKVMRVLGNLLDLTGFEYTSAEEVCSEMEGLFSDVPMGGGSEWLPESITTLPQGLLRIADVPIYAVDAMVRRSSPLQATKDADVAKIRANAATLAQAGLNGAEQARLRQGDCEVVLPVVEDAAIPDNAIALPAGLAETVGLAGSYTPVELTSA